MAFVNCTYTGVFQVRRFHFTVGHGGVCMAILDIAPQSMLPSVNGVLYLTDGFRELVVPGCRVDRANMVLSTTGHVTRIQILGPTWKWARAGIDGTYNVKRPDGTFEPGTEKTPQELASLLFQSMRVPFYNVSGMPNSTRPFVNWRGDLAFHELRNLCDGLGCDFGIDLQGDVAEVWQVGNGANLPTGDEITVDFELDLSEMPDVIRVYGGNVIVQSKLKMECVMPDKDGTIKRIEDLSYVPLGGWDGQDPFNPLAGSTDTVAKALAKKYLYRMWRAKSQADGTQNVPKIGQVSGIEDILPLYDRLVDDYEDAGIFEKEGFLEGTFAIDSAPQPYKNTAAYTLIEVPHTTDGERGIVTTATPIAKLNNLDQWTKADVYYTCSYNVRDSSKFGYVYYGFERQMAQNGTGTWPVHRPDLIVKIIGQYTGRSLTGTTDNIGPIDVEMQSQIFSAAAEFQASGAVVKRYRGLVPIRLDGAIRQVTYMGACTGRSKGFFTVASRNTEFECGIDRRSQRSRKSAAERARIMRDLHVYEQFRSSKKGQMR